MEDTNLNTLERTNERLTAVVDALEQLATNQQSVGRIVATVEGEREADLQRRLEEAEAKIAELTASAGRKTVAAGIATTIAKHGAAVEGLHAGSIDAALVGLSVEQRIAVKAELLRAGVIG